MFNSIFDSSSGGLGITTGLICAATALALGIVIAITHMKTSHTSKGFLTTLATLPLLVMAVIIMINGNLGTSIAILGAFSLIRFRSIQGQAKDLLSVFFAMTVGLACGMGHILFAAIVTLVAVVAIVLFSNTHFLEPNKRQRILKIVIPEDLDYEEVFDEIFSKYTTHAELTRMKTINMGSLYKLTYDITMKSSVKEKDFLDELRVKNCNLKILLSHPCLEEEI